MYKHKAASNESAQVKYLKIYSTWETVFSDFDTVVVSGRLMK